MDIIAASVRCADKQKSELTEKETHKNRLCNKKLCGIGIQKKLVCDKNIECVKEGDEYLDMSNLLF